MTSLPKQHAKRAYGIGVGDFCHVVSPHKSELPFIALITEIRANKAKLRWMYRAQDLQTQPSVKPEPKEIFYSSHSDWNAFPECVQSGIQVLVRAGQNGENIFFSLSGDQSSSSSSSSSGEGVYDYVCKQEYNLEQHQVRPLSVETLKELKAYRESTPRKRSKVQQDESSRKHAAAAVTTKEVPAKPFAAIATALITPKEASMKPSAVATPKEVPTKSSTDPTPKEVVTKEVQAKPAAVVTPKEVPTKPSSDIAASTKQQIQITPLSVLQSGDYIWTAKACVTWKGNLLHNVESRQNSFFIVIEDMEGTSMRCQFVGKAATLYCDFVQVGKAYSFSGGVCTKNRKEVLACFDKNAHILPLEEVNGTVEGKAATPMVSLVDAKIKPVTAPVVVPPPPPRAFVAPPVAAAPVVVPPPPPRASVAPPVVVPPPPSRASIAPPVAAAPLPPPPAPAISVPAASAAPATSVSATFAHNVPPIRASAVAAPRPRGRPRLTPSASVTPAAASVTLSAATTAPSVPPAPLPDAVAAAAATPVRTSSAAITSVKPPFPLGNALLDVLVRSPKMKRADTVAALFPQSTAPNPDKAKIVDTTPSTPAKTAAPTTAKPKTVTPTSLTLPPTKLLPSSTKLISPPSTTAKPSSTTKQPTKRKPQFLPTPPDSSSSSDDDDSVSVYEEEDNDDEEPKEHNKEPVKSSLVPAVLSKPALPIKSAPPLPLPRIKPVATTTTTTAPLLTTQKPTLSIVKSDEANKVRATTTTTTSPPLSSSPLSPSPRKETPSPNTTPPLAKAVPKQYMLVHRSSSVAEDEYKRNIEDEYQATLPMFRGRAVRPKVDDYVYNFRGKSIAPVSRKPICIGDIVPIMITDPKATQSRDQRRMVWYRVVGENYHDTIQCVPYESVFSATQSCAVSQSFSRADVFDEYKEQHLYEQLGVAFSSSLYFPPTVGFHIPTLGDALTRAASERAQRALHIDLISLSLGSPLSHPQLFYAPKMRLVSGISCSKCNKNTKNHNSKQGRKPILVYCARYFESCQVALCKMCFRGGKVAGFDSERVDAGSEFEEASYSHWFCGKCCAVPKDTLLLELEASKAHLVEGMEEEPAPLSQKQQALQAFSASAKEILVSVETKQMSTEQALTKLCKLFLQHNNNAT